MRKKKFLLLIFLSLFLGNVLPLSKVLAKSVSATKTEIHAAKGIRTSSNDKDQLEKAKKSYTGVGLKKDYFKAFELFLPLARGGNAEAARFVGLMKFSGKGTTKDVSEARQWLSVAAQKGDPTATELLVKYKALFK